MQIGMIGLGRMGANMARRLLTGGHQCVVFNRSRAPVDALVELGAVGTSSLADLVKNLKAPRAIWMMVPSAIVETVIADQGSAVFGVMHSQTKNLIELAAWTVLANVVLNLDETLARP